MRFTVCFFLIACTAVTWNDTFRGTDQRATVDSGAPPADAGDTSQACANIAASKPTVPITVTFPGHDAGAEKIHVTSGASSCDLTIDTDTDGVAFASDALPCAALLAPGTPASGTATASGTSSPSDLLFQWSYSVTCTIVDDYTLSKQ